MVAAVVVLLVCVLYVAHVTQQGAHADVYDQDAPQTYCERVEQAIDEAEQMMSGPSHGREAR
jgi:hypothetical protein